jgi:hypothetical protein
MEWNPASKRGKKKQKTMTLILFVGILQSVPT